MPSKLTVFCNKKENQAYAKRFADQNNLPFTDQQPITSSIYFSFENDQPVLYDTNINSSINIDFTSSSMAHRLQYGGGKGMTIAKAIGVTSKNKPHILDATAGLGRDSIILANLGSKVSLIEQSPVLAEMLKQAIHFANDNELFQKATANGFNLYQANAAEFMNNKIIPEADVVYLDPMYPEKKKSALVKKDMQILQNLIGHSSEAKNTELLTAALNFATQRVVVKRPKSANPLIGPTPTMSLHSKKTRYDVYVIKAMQG